MTRATIRARRALSDLARARDALAAARAAHRDPWEVEALRLQYERLQEAALAAEDVYDDAVGPGPRLGRGGR